MNKNLSILLVDDDMQSIEVVTNYLKSAGFQWIYTLHNGKSALEFLEKNAVDMIISDWEMPEMDGLGLLQAVRNHPKLSKTPFLMIASQTSHEKMKILDAKNTGVDAYLVKPFRNFMLLEKIANVLFEREWSVQRGALVIDDDQSVRDFVSTALKQLGFSPVHVAADGVEGFSKLEANFSEISIVVCDWDMPKMTGIELLRKVRSTSTLAKIPFLMATAQIPGAEMKKLTSAIESDVDHYLLKPFRVNDLKEKIDLALSKAKAKAYPRHLLENAQTALAIGDLESAEKLFTGIVSKYPTNAEAYLGLAKTEFAQDDTKNVDSAIKNIQRAIQLNPAWSVPHIQMAQMFEAKMSLDKAIECIKNAIKKGNVVSADLHYHLGRLYLKRGRADVGAEELKRALEINPNHEEALKLMSGKSGDTK